VRKETCAEVAREIDLGAVLRLGRSEMLSGGRRKEALLADAMEAVIAAVYLDAGFEAARAASCCAFGARGWQRRGRCARRQDHAAGMGAGARPSAPRYPKPPRRPAHAPRLHHRGAPGRAARRARQRRLQAAGRTGRARLLERLEGGDELNDRHPDPRGLSSP
jgi:ribonuclease III